MATTSTLKAMQDLHSGVNDPPGGWTTEEAKIQVIYDFLTGSGSSLSLSAVVAAGVSGGSTGVTITSTSLGASDTVTIPIGAKSWSATILTGTGTINGVASLPAGFSASDPNKLAVAIVVSTASASSAYVQWAI